MIVYQNSKTCFLTDAFTKDIEEVVLAAFHAQTGKRVSGSEVRSWKEPLLAVAKVLNNDGIPGDCGVAIEYGIPQTSKRIDFILSGKSAEQLERVVIIELRQWETARKTD
jgi:hypothetical protein